MQPRVKEKKIPILMYHSISQDATPAFKPFTVPLALFADHMNYLHQYGYTPLTVTQLVTMRARLLLPEWPVVITFDDGLADFFTNALPILRRYGFVATLYVTTAFINSTSRWLQREGESTRPMLTWEQLTEISRHGIECGGHSHSHYQLDTLSLSTARDEIVRCKKLLESHLGQEVLSFAYPHGYHTAAIQQLVREAGYTSACAVKYAMSSMTTDPFALARLLVSVDTSVDNFATLLTQPFPSTIKIMYTAACRPAWRLVRRCSAWMHGTYQKAC